MSEHPIIFSTEMVGAILDGRKTQSRRILTERDCWRNGLSKKHNIVSLENAYPVFTKEYLRVPFQHKDDRQIDWDECGSWRVDAKYQVGDRLWVRETFRYAIFGLGCGGRASGIEYKTGDIKFTKKAHKYARQIQNKDKYRQHARWRPSIHMPRWAARIFLEITKIRVERVQDISRNDAVAEGCREKKDEQGWYSPEVQFVKLWDSLNAKRGYGWDKNPWVWVIEFKQA